TPDPDEDRRDEVPPESGPSPGGSVPGGPEPGGAGLDARPPAERTRRRRSLRAQLLIALMSVLLGIGIVAQVRQTQEDEVAALRRDDLIRLLAEVTESNEQQREARTQPRRD